MSLVRVNNINFLRAVSCLVCIAAVSSVVRVGYPGSFMIAEADRREEFDSRKFVKLGGSLIAEPFDEYYLLRWVTSVPFSTFETFCCIWHLVAYVVHSPKEVRAN